MAKYRRANTPIKLIGRGRIRVKWKIEERNGRYESNHLLETGINTKDGVVRLTWSDEGINLVDEWGIPVKSQILPRF